jgi:hypothetical protein
MNTRCKYHYKSGLYFLNFSSNVIQKTVFTNVSLPDNVEPNSNFDNVKKNKKNIQKKLDGNANVKKYLILIKNLILKL